MFRNCSSKIHMDGFYLHLNDPASCDLIPCHWLYNICRRNISVLFEYFCYRVWVPTVNWICGTGLGNNYAGLGSTLAASFEHWARCENLACLFYKYYFGGCSSELAGLLPFLYPRRGLFAIQIGSIFLSRILYEVIMHVPFVVLLITEILSL